MKRLILTAVAVCGLAVSGLIVRAADEKKDDAKAGEKVTGILIDNNCGAKQKDEQAAAKHPKACVLKCGKDGDMTLISGKDVLKLDDASKTKAMEYLAKAESTKVTVEGTKEGDTLKIDKIEAAK